MKKYLYTAFGLCFESETELPELPLYTGTNRDVTIVRGLVPDNIENPVRQTIRFQLSENDFILKVAGIARYRVQTGTVITIEPEKDAATDDVRLFLYGSALAALFHQRGMMPLHATTVYNETGALGFAGNSGAGKSTTSFSLIETGKFRLVSDDITILNYCDGKIRVQPGMPHLKLWADILEYSSKDLSTLKNIRNEIQKFRFPVTDHFSDQPVELRALYFLSSQHQKEVSIVPVTGTEKFNLLQNNIFRSQFVTGREMQEKYFKLTTTVLQKVQVFRLVRPRLGMTAEEVRDKVINSLL
jgi:hypothetical protein